MTMTEPRDSENLSDNLNCPRCSASLLPQALFCSSCGERINKGKNEEREARAENSGDAQEHGIDDTVRIPLLSRARLQSYRSLKNNGVTGQTSKSSAPPQNVAIPAFEELNTPSIVESAEDVVGMKPISDEASKFPMVSNNKSAVTGSLSETWGWLPALSLTSAIGVFLVALAYEGGRVVAKQWPEPLFWIGLLVIFLPVAAHLILSKAARRERLALLIVLAIALYLVKYLSYPLYFTGYDEFSHWRTAYDIIASGHLFHVNPLLPISSFYPGLEIIISALSNLTGLSIFATGNILISVVQIVFVLALYLFYEHFTDSGRIAGIATLLYMANPNFLFFDMDFAYESLALPLAVFVLFAVARRSYAPAGRRRGLTLVIWLGIGAVVVTHHVTSYALVAFLLLWTAVFLVLRAMASFYQSRIKKDQVGPSPGWVALLSLALSIAWLIFTGDMAVGYLMPHLDSIMQQLRQVLANQSPPRQLFHNPSGFVVPFWERMVAYLSVALIWLGLPFGLFQIWRYRRTNAAVLALAGAALAYPASQALRLTPAGGETGDRATEFVFLGVAIVLAIGATEFWFSRTQSWRRSAILIGVVGVICFGQMILGSGQPWALLPGPYLVSADARSIEPEGLTAAEWANAYLGPRHSFASDRINTLLMGTYGGEQVITAGSDNIPLSQVFTSLHFGPGVIGILQQDRVQYLVVDHRLSTSLPYIGTYFNKPASGTQQYTKPIDPAALAKFDGVQNISRIFDSGDIVIYDIEAITNGIAVVSKPQSLCTPVPSTVVSSSDLNIAKQYTGTIYDIPRNMTINISLTGIEQQQGVICGSFGETPTNAHFTAIPTNGPFKGTITTSGQIQFILTSTGQAAFSFNGLILPDGDMVGTYCSTEASSTGKCSDYGLWSVSPAQPG